MSPRGRAWLVGVVAVVVAGLAAYGLTGRSPGASPSASPPFAATASTGTMAASATAAPSGVSSPVGTPTGDACSESDPCVDPGPSALPSGAPVAVLVTNSGWDTSRHVLWVAGEVPVVEDGGQCVLTATSGGRTLTAQAAAEAGPASTSCVVELADPALVPGTWSATLRYSSAQHAGQASDVTITVG